MGCHMKGIFVNQLSASGVPYADAIVSGYKTIETRNRDMLSHCVGEHVAVIKTVRGKMPTIVGYVTINSKLFANAQLFDLLRGCTLIPVGSKYDIHGKGKWCYCLNGAERCEPYALPKDAIRHGRSWCEFNI